MRQLFVILMVLSSAYILFFLRVSHCLTLARGNQWFHLQSGRSMDLFQGIRQLWTQRSNCRTMDPSKLIESSFWNHPNVAPAGFKNSKVGGKYGTWGLGTQPQAQLPVREPRNSRRRARAPLARHNARFFLVSRPGA